MLRDATARDLPAIAAITAYYVEHTAIHFAYTPPTEGMLAADLAAAGLHPWLVAVDATDRVRGYARSGPFRSRAAYARSAELGVYLAPDARGHGLGRALVEAVLHHLTAADFHVAIAGIALPNPASVALFERCGFTAVGVFREVGWKFDRWHDVGFWQRRLAADRVTPGA